MNSGDDADQRNKNKILKGLLDEDKDNGVYNKVNASTSPRMGQHRPNETKTGNNLLLNLLNEKSDDDDASDQRSSQRTHSELLRQLQKDEQPKDHSNSNQMGNDELIQLLRIQGNDFTNRKRTLTDSDDSPSAKRSEDKPSKLREKNKMLASLLSGPSKAPTTFTQPMVKTIPDIAQSRIPNVGPQQMSPQQMVLNNNQKNAQQLGSLQALHQARSNQQQSLRKPTDLYLNPQMQTQQVDMNKGTNQVMIMMQPSLHSTYEITSSF